MKPVKTPTTNTTFVLSGGTKENDLPLEKTTSGGMPILISVWELEDDERTAIANGATIELVIWGSGHPPVSLGIGESIKGRENGI